MENLPNTMPNIPVKEIKTKSQKIRQKIQHQMYSYIVAAFGLVAGLAWNEAIKSLIDYLFPLSKNTLMAKFFYALLITLIVVLVTLYLSRILKDEETEGQF